MKYTLLLLPVLGMLIMTGCASADATKTSSATYAETDPSKVQILFEKPERKYDVIGFISGTGTHMASQDAVFKAMKEEGAKLGADAVLIRDDIKEGDYWHNYEKKGNALAIKWK